MALIHVELRIQEHHRLMSHSETLCDQMETQILRKVQQNYERKQATKAESLNGKMSGPCEPDDMSFITDNSAIQCNN